MLIFAILISQSLCFNEDLVAKHYSQVDAGVDKTIAGRKFNLEKSSTVEKKPFYSKNKSVSILLTHGEPQKSISAEEVSSYHTLRA